MSGYLEEEGEEKKGVLEYENLSDRSVDSVKMVRKEETEVGRLLKYIIERDAKAKKAEARERKEQEQREERDIELRLEMEKRKVERKLEAEQREVERRREAELRREVENARRLDMVEMFRQLKEEESRRRVEEDAQRRRDEEESRRRRKAEEEELREKRDLQQEKLKVLGSYKEGVKLLGYLNMFERIMHECKFDRGGWNERLFPRLPERLCTRIAGVRDEGASYDEVKRVLLKAVGETTLTYGHQLFELTGEALKAKSAGEIVEVIERVCRGGTSGM